MFRVVIEKSELIKSLRVHQQIIDKKPTQIIFSYIKLEAKDNSLVIESTDGDTLLNHKTKVDIIGEGVITLPGNMFYNLVRKISDTKIEISQTSTQSACVKYKKGSFDLEVINHEKWPKLTQQEHQKCFSGKSAELIKILRVSKTSISSNEAIRSSFNGVLLECNGEDVVFASTDSFRMSIYSRDIISNEDLQKNNTSLEVFNKFKFMISKKLVEIILILLEDSTELSFYKNEQHVKIESSNFSLTSRLLPENFPKDYQNLVLKNEESSFECSLEDLKEVLDRVSTISMDSLKNISVNLKSKMNLECYNDNYGSSKEDIDGIHLGDESSFKIQFQTWMDFLRAFNSGNIKVEYHGKNKPIILKSMQEPNFVYITSPIE